MKTWFGPSRSVLFVVGACGAIAVSSLEAGRVRAQASEPSAANDSASESVAGRGGRLIVLKRQPLRLVLRERFDVHPQLQPRRRTMLRAEVRGRVVDIAAKPGERLSAQQTILRIDAPEYLLQQRIARQRLSVLETELEHAREAKDAAAEQLARLRIELAKLELERAEAAARKTAVLAPYAGTLLDIRVEVGDYVEPGTPVAEVADLSAMAVNLPVRADETEVGQELTLQVDTEQVTGTVRAILPLHERYAALHALQIHLVSAIVDIDNSSGRLMPGWVVGVPLVPQAPVVRVPLRAVSSDEKGKRHVFVLRDNQIRRVDVRLLGQLGTESVFVSGEFAQGDELITSSSVELIDGTIVRPAADQDLPVRAETGGAAGPQRTAPLRTPNTPKKKVGF